MKSCEAFANAGVLVALVLPTKVRVIKDNPFTYYAVKRNFSIQRIPALDLIWLLPERIGFYLNALTFCISAIFFALTYVRRGDITYSRDYATLAVLCLFGFRPVAEIHDYRSQKPKKLIAFILKHTRAVIVNSEGTKSLLMDHYVCDTKILVAPNAVDPAFFDISETKEQAREKLGLPQDRIIISYVGRMSVAGAGKGIESLREAYEHMRHRDRTELLIVGGAELSIPYSMVPLYLRAIDIAVIPFPGSQHAKTTSPIKLFEYMAAGKAIVIADSPDPQELAEKLDALAANPERIATLSAQSREGAQHYTWTGRAVKVIDFLRKKGTILTP
ncbi:MAG: glycosyltransferase [Patescibacteria group bacterium]